MRDLRSRWDRCWAALDLPSPVHAYEDLVQRYAASQRAYHTLEHIRECLTWLERAHDAAERPAEVELALWFHDVIYDPRRNDNEARSADMATRTILEAGGSDALAARIDVLIVATADHGPVEDPDTRLLIDIDLSILGAREARFDEYERQIRQEYAWVPAPRLPSGSRALPDVHARAPADLPDRGPRSARSPRPGQPPPGPCPRGFVGSAAHRARPVRSSTHRAAELRSRPAFPVGSARHPGALTWPRHR